NTIDFRMNPAEAASVARFHHQWLPDELRVEKGLNQDTQRLLRERGHNVVTKASMGRTQTIMVTGDGVMRGYSDPRNPDGRTLGNGGVALHSLKRNRAGEAKACPACRLGLAPFGAKLPLRRLVRACALPPPARGQASNGEESLGF